MPAGCGSVPDPEDTVSRSPAEDTGSADTEAASAPIDDPAPVDSAPPDDAEADDPVPDDGAPPAEESPAADDDEPESAGWAKAIPGVLATAAPTPNATANAPTRPICLAYPMMVSLLKPAPHQRTGAGRLDERSCAISRDGLTRRNADVACWAGLAAIRRTLSQSSSILMAASLLSRCAGLLAL